MTSSPISLTTFERRLKAGIFIGAATLASPLYGAIAAGVYALTAVTLTAMVCPRTWALRLLGNAMVVALFLLPEKHIPSWAGYLPAVMFVILGFLGYNHERVVGRWHSGTDLLIARIVEKGASQQNPTHKISWLVYSNEDLSEDQLRTIKCKFCGGCPKPSFQQPWSRPQVVDICLRSVQVWYSQEEGRLLQRVSEWCAPRWHQPVEFEYRPSLPQRLDQFASDFFALTSLLVVLPVAVIIKTDGVREWGLMDMGDKIFVTAVAALIFKIGLPFGMFLEVLCGLGIRATIMRLTSLFKSMRRYIFTAWSSIKGAFMAGARGTKAAAKWIRSCSAWTSKTALKAVRTIANGTSNALNWIRPRISQACEVVVNIGPAVASVVKQLLPAAGRSLEEAWILVDRVSSVALVLSMSVLAAQVTFLLIDWRGLVSEVRSSTGACLLRLSHVVTAASLTLRRVISLQCVVRAAAAAAVVAAGAFSVAAAIGVAAGLARAFVLTTRAARDRCSCLVASGYKKRTLLRKARGAGRCCRRLKLAPLDGAKKEHTTASALVAAAWRDVVRLDGGQQPQAKRRKYNLAKVHEVAKRRFAEQKAAEIAAISACAAKEEGALPQLARRGPQRKSRVAAPVGSANASTPALRRSLRTRS